MRPMPRPLPTRLTTSGSVRDPALLCLGTASHRQPAVLASRSSRLIWPTYSRRSSTSPAGRAEARSTSLSMRRTVFATSSPRALRTVLRSRSASSRSCHRLRHLRRLRRRQASRRLRPSRRTLQARLSRRRLRQSRHRQRASCLPSARFTRRGVVHHGIQPHSSIGWATASRAMATRRSGAIHPCSHVAMVRSLLSTSTTPRSAQWHSGRCRRSSGSSQH